MCFWKSETLYQLREENLAEKSWKIRLAKKWIELFGIIMDRKYDYVYQEYIKEEFRNFEIFSIEKLFGKTSSF